jgi:RND superfamily putative drug exporter
MLAGPLPLFRAISAGAIAVVTVGVVAALTLLPALLRVLGPRLAGSRPTSPRPQPAHETGSPGRRPALPPGRAVAGLLVTVALLLPLGAKSFDADYALDLRLFEEGRLRTPPPEIAAVHEELTATLQAVVEVVVDAQRTAEVEAAVARLTEAIGNDARFVPVLVVQWNAGGNLAVVTAVLATGPGLGQDSAALTSLRDEIIPETFVGLPARVLLAGPAAVRVEVTEILAAWQPRVMALVLALTYLLLTVAFRSLVAPLVAILANLLSVAVAQGVLVLALEHGVGARWLGFGPSTTVEAWLPIVLFCVIFGLSMDYHVFLLSRIKEHAERSRDTRAAIALGSRDSRGVILAAAVIMVAVFAGFSTGRLDLLRQVGLGLAVAILLDATLIRSILVPSCMTLLGRWNWYLPGWLECLPELRTDSLDRREAPDAVHGLSPAPAVVTRAASDPG